jgi:hypothetical protein
VAELGNDDIKDEVGIENESFSVFVLFPSELVTSTFVLESGTRFSLIPPRLDVFRLDPRLGENSGFSTVISPLI